MKLQTLLLKDPKELSPQAVILVDLNHHLTAQTVVYQPETLNLGAILIGYYSDPEKVAQLSRLGNCLSVGHYVRSPRTLRYGLNFTDNPAFQKLPAKQQKHLTGEIQDCTISFGRDYGIKSPARQITDLNEYLTKLQGIRYVYLYQNHAWQIMKDGQFVDLRKQVALRLHRDDQ